MDASYLEFMAERSAETNGHLLTQVREAGESELAQSADEITKNMLKKAFEFGFAQGFKEGQAESAQPSTGDGVTGD